MYGTGRVLIFVYLVNPQYAVPVGLASTMRKLRVGVRRWVYKVNLHITRPVSFGQLYGEWCHRWCCQAHAAKLPRDTVFYFVWKAHVLTEITENEVLQWEGLKTYRLFSIQTLIEKLSSLKVFSSWTTLWSYWLQVLK